MEKLAAQYTAAKRKQPDLFRERNLFSAEEIIVPSGGMRQWLKRCLADQGFLLSNVLFTSLPAFFDRLFRKTENAFDRDVLTWRIVSILKKDSAGEFKELSTYVNGGKREESADLRCFGLADKIASLFVNYLTECPEMLSGWSKNEINEKAVSWQAKLWKRLCTGPNGEKLVSPADQITALLDGDFSIISETALRPVTVWGCSTMPLRQLAMLKKLSIKVPVHCFCLNPCDSIWTDDLRQKWSDGQKIQEPAEIEELYEGTLLRQWSNHERTFFRYLTGTDEIPCCQGEKLAERQIWQSSKEASASVLRKRFTDEKKDVPAGPRGTLRHLQDTLRGRKDAAPEADDSLTIHCCHNELREVEILRDHLLHLVASHGYSNSDILVAAPDISVFAPCIDAVFRQPVRKDGPGIPYAINGRSIREDNPLADAFILLLDTCRYRYELGFIEKLLNFEEIRSRFSILEDEIGLLIENCKEAGIRWGKDGDHGNYVFPDFDNFSWQQGSDRILLGLALDDEGTLEGVWQEIVPYNKFDSPDGHVRLQNLITFLQALQKLERDFAAPCGIEEWKNRLKWLMEQFFRCDMKRKTYYRGLWEAINLAVSSISRSGYTQDTIPLEVIREAVSARIRVSVEQDNFLTGAISFSNLKDIRGIPCKVLCLLGMDNGAYPRASRPDSLNLVEEQQARENRTVSQQDRYFFLESFLAVRDYLLIYYRGMDDASDKRYYSSALVSDLRSYAEKLFPKMKRTKKQMEDGNFGFEIQHSLLPYSHRYYTENQNEPSLRNLWSYNAASRQIDAYVHNNADWLLTEFGANDADVPPPGGVEQKKNNCPVPEFLKKQRESFRQTNLFSDAERENLRCTPVRIPLKMLEDFIQNAGFTFLKSAMHFNRMPKVDESLPDIEPVHLSGLEKWDIISNKLFPWMLGMGKSPYNIGPEDLTRLYERLKAENTVPLGKTAEEFCVKELLSMAWIKDDNLRKLWKQQTGSKRGKETLELDFSGKVPVIPETELRDLPEFCKDLEKIPNRYTDVKVVYETTKKDGEPYIYLALASKAPKHRIRAWVRHLFFNTFGECETHIIWKDGSAKTYSTMEKKDAWEKLRAIVALYLYGQTHAVPFLCQCSTAATTRNGQRDSWINLYSKPSYNDESWERGDDQLDYATMLWARNVEDLKGQDELCTVIENLADCILEGVLS